MRGIERAGQVIGLQLTHYVVVTPGKGWLAVADPALSAAATPPLHER
jgi:hypothetical protein